MKVEGFLDVLCDALGKEPGTLTCDDTPTTVEEWDSVGHLSIIASLDEELGVPVDNEGLRKFASIGELVDRLVARNALEK
ncbi:MAG: acyl carrier protein [Planctomycetes bacterium]|nr:acyl carrier protein [Planctomycetota bacterium]